MNGIEARFRIAHGRFRLDVEFDAPGRGVTGLFGPSGSGKTTLLRCMAGFLRERGGFLEVHGETWQDDQRGFSLPSHKRAVGYVFQEASLFPHLSVRGNLTYGYRRVPESERRLDFDSVVRLLGLPALLDRDPQTLSGGERQRVAIGRALLASPRLLLMDEPLASLDLVSKSEILPYLDRLHEELSLPVIYVSHQPSEIVRLADHVLIMGDGRILDHGPPGLLASRLHAEPGSAADSLCVTIPAVADGYDSRLRLARLRVAEGELRALGAPLKPGQPVQVRIHARDVTISLDGQSRDSALNVLSTVVRSLSAEGAGETRVELNGGGMNLLSVVPSASVERLGLEPGKPVFAQVHRLILDT